MPFLLEMDLGIESLTILANKIVNYVLLAEMTRWRWLVLFWLPPARRELNLHQLLTDTDVPDWWPPPPATAPPQPASRPPRTCGGCTATTVPGPRLYELPHHDPAEPA
ncbi:MAG TPA: hypothetical protein VFW27_28165 [Actinoplanes sp.]|jgi:hypothetical protein|nr:hypothetical protein [Actinoplanes sp.]